MCIHLEQVLETLQAGNDMFAYYTQTGETVALFDAIETSLRDDALEEEIENAPPGRGSCLCQQSTTCTNMA